MSRLNDYMDFENKRYEDVDGVLELDSDTADVYRVDFNVDSPGFDDEVGDEVRVGRISVHLARKSGPTRASQGGGITIPSITYVAVTTSTDILLNDRWVIKGQSYLVTDIEKLGVKSEVILTKQE